MEDMMTERPGFGLLIALRKRYEADIASALANIEIYTTSPTGIGEHSNIVSAVDTEITKLCEAADKLKTLIEFFRI